MAEDQHSDPARAFEDLRAEVSVLRKAVEALPAAIRDNRPPDYAPDLAVLGKGLDEIATELETLLKSPALGQTPEQQGQSIARAGSVMIQEAAQKLDRAAQETDRERYNLSQMIGTLRGKRDQRFWVVTVGVSGLLIGFLASPLLIRALPFGIAAATAATIMNANEWDAGLSLMKDSNPSGWSKIFSDANLAQDNRDKIKACRALANKAKKDQRCLIIVKAR